MTTFVIRYRLKSLINKHSSYLDKHYCCSREEKDKIDVSFPFYWEEVLIRCPNEHYLFFAITSLPHITYTNDHGPIWYQSEVPLYVSKEPKIVSSDK